jgi:hypothetical protein
MAKIVNRAEGSVAVEYGTFALLDAHGTSPVPWPDAVDEELGDGTITANPNRLDIRSVAAFHHAHVEMTAWDGPPPAPEGGWDDDHEVTFASDSGGVRLCGVTTGPQSDNFEIGPPHHIYGLRMYCSGRDRTLEADARGMPPEGSERYDMRFWPIREV